MLDWFANGWESFCQGFYSNLIYADRWLMLLKGLLVTLEITFAAIILGTILGVILAFMKMSGVKLFRGIAKTYIEIIRGTPTTVQLLIMYLGVFAVVSAPKWIIASIAFGMNSAAYVAEIIRGGVESVDKGQIEAGRSLGFSKFQTTMKIVLPQAIKIALPTYTSEFIVLLKETSIAGYIAMEDLTKVASMITSRTYNAWFPLITAAVLYFIMTFTLAKIFGCLERRLRKSDLR